MNNIVSDGRRCVVIGGAEIKRYDILRDLLRPNDFIICCDSGLRHLTGFGVTPDLVIGDFDSWEKTELPVETIVLPREKDDTDSMAAVREAAVRGFKEFFLVGVIGGRLDHTLANVSILFWLDNRGMKAAAADDFSEIEVISRRPAYIEDRYPFFSLLDLRGTAKGITIKNAKYTLEDAVIPADWQFAVSNEPLPGKTAEVTVREGQLLLIKDRPEVSPDPNPQKTAAG